MTNTSKYATGRASRDNVKRISTPIQSDIAYTCIYISIINNYKNW